MQSINHLCVGTRDSKMIEWPFYVSAKGFVTILPTSFPKTRKERTLFQKFEPDWKTTFSPLTSVFFTVYAQALWVSTEIFSASVERIDKQTNKYGNKKWIELMSWFSFFFPGLSQALTLLPSPHHQHKPLIPVNRRDSRTGERYCLHTLVYMVVKQLELIERRLSQVWGFWPFPKCLNHNPTEQAVDTE